MGRPTKFNRRDAVEIAMNTFWQKGFAPTSVSDLASAMSITRSSFYNSFESREQIFTEALALYRADEFDISHSGENSHLSPTRRIKLFFRDVCAKLAADPFARGCLIINCYVQACNGTPLPEGVQTFIDSKTREFNDLIEQSVAEGVLPPSTNVAAAADATMAYLVGLNVMGRSIRGEAALWAASEAFLTGLGFPVSEH